MIVVNARFLTQKLTGVQRFALEITKKLVNLRDDIILVSPKNIINKQVARDLNVQTYGWLKGHLWEQFELPIFLKKHDNPLLLNLANTAPLNYENMVVTIHDLAVFRYPQAFSWKFQKYYRFVLPRIAGKSRKIFTVSNFSKGEIIKLFGIKSEKIEVIYNAVSTEIACNNVNSEREKFILTVSSLDPRKNLSKLIEAFKKLELKEYKLIIAGAKSSVFKSIDAPENSERIEFLGHVRNKELSELYIRASLFVYPSLYEGFGIPPLEAMKCGCPVVVSDIPPHREVCGEAALYVNPFNIEDIRNGIQKVLRNRNLWGELSMKGQERAKFFSWIESARKVNEIIDALTSQK